MEKSNFNFNFDNDVEHFEGNDPFRKSRRVARSPPTVNATTVTTGQIAPVSASTTARKAIVETVIDTTPHCGTTVAEEPQRNSSPRLELIHKMRTLEEESLAHCREIMLETKVVITRQGIKVSNDIKWIFGN